MGEQANTIAAAGGLHWSTSPIFIRCARPSISWTGEIKDLILAARADRARRCPPAGAADETDPLVKQAISTYVKAEFGLDSDDADKYRASFRSQRSRSLWPRSISNPRRRCSSRVLARCATLVGDKKKRSTKTAQGRDRSAAGGFRQQRNPRPDPSSTPPNGPEQNRPRPRGARLGL